MNNIVLDFRHNYVRGERLESQEIVYQYDTGRIVEAYVPETEEGFVLNIGFENTSVLSVISVDDVVVDEEGGYKILATIPDSILAGYGNLLVYVVAGGGANVLATTYEGIVPVRCKPVAEGYIPPDDPATSIIERCEVAAAAAVEAADDARDIADSVQGATAIATAAAETATSAAETATSAATRAETAATAAEAAMVDKLDNTFITGLDESASGDDTDLLAVGYRGASTLRKFSFANLATYIRDKLTSLTFSSLNTSNKTLPGAINEVRSGLIQAAGDVTIPKNTSAGLYNCGSIQTIFNGGSDFVQGRIFAVTPIITSGNTAKLGNTVTWLLYGNNICVNVVSALTDGPVTVRFNIIYH